MCPHEVDRLEVAVVGRVGNPQLVTRRVSRVLLALIAGLIVGVVAGATGSQWALTALHVIAPLGTLWINAIRMTVVPLVIALLFTSIVGTDKTSEIGREAVVSTVTFVGILLFAAGVAWLLAPHLIEDMRVTPETSAALRASASTAASATRLQLDHLPGFGDWLIGLVPANAVRAAAAGNARSKSPPTASQQSRHRDGRRSLPGEPNRCCTAAANRRPSRRGTERNAQR